MNRKTMTMAILAAAAAATAETVSVKSPDGMNEIRLDTEPTLAYTVLRAGKALTAASPIALEVAGKGTLGGAGLKIASKTACDRAGRIETPIYKKASIDESAKGVRVSFGDWAIDLVARNDGVAYRFATSFKDAQITVSAERAPVVFASGEQTVWAAPNWGAGEKDPLQNSWEGVYEKRKVADAPKDFSDVAYGLWYAPLTFEYPDGTAMVVTESDLLDYPGWNFQAGGDGRSLKGLFGAYPKKTTWWEWGKTGYTDYPTRYQRIQSREDFLAKTAGTRTFPWRTFLLAGSLAKLAESDIVYALATPSKIGDSSWVKPGKVAWDWWNCWNVTGVKFRAGCNTKTYEYFIDFASKFGVEYIIFDEGWSKHLQIFEFNPEVDVPHLVKYAAERNVGIILWGAWAQFFGREEQVAAHYAKLGVKGFKIDFMDRDDQAMLRFFEKMSSVAAKYHLMLDYHGMFKPTGLQRTYPNIVNFEGVHGLECCKWGKAETFMPVKDCTLVFTRMAAGPMDYTPGAMRNGLRDWAPTPKCPSTPGTRVHQMALMTLFEAPLQMLCDSPTQYLKNEECFRFMASVPTTWDDVVALGGEMDAYAALARRKGDAWYVAAICGWDGRKAVVDTTFLGAGEWNAEIFADGANADRDATDYVRETRVVKAGEKIDATLLPGGGWTARFTRR